jgi:hypothetical protein
MYGLVLALHSWLRWIALVSGVGATLATVRDQSSVTETGRADRWGLALMMALDIQLLLGLLLYLVVSPNMEAIRSDFGAAMKDPAARFWAVEHLAMMLVAVVLVHVGRILGRKAKTAQAKRTRLLICFGLATLLMLLGIPWPGMASGRPLFRF